MTQRSRLWRWTLALSCTLGLAGACSGGGLVGGECRSGLNQCDKLCVDLRSDVENCGACGMTCAADQFCNVGVCRLHPAGDGGAAGAGGVGGNAGLAGAVNLGGTLGLGGGASGAGGVFQAGGGGLGIGGFGGSAGVSGSGGAPVSGGSGGVLASGGSGGMAGTGGDPNPPPVCDLPTIACGQSCVDTLTDPGHCGGCNQPCASGLCTGGACLGTASGHIVLLCTNMRQSSTTSSFGVLLGNAEFLSLNKLPPNRPVRILGYSKYADAPSVTSTNATLTYAAAQRGRTIQLTSITDDVQLLTQLNTTDHEVFVMYDQPNAPLNAMAQNGSLWAVALDKFVGLGGTVIMLSSGTSVRGDGDMDEFATNAGLLSITGETQANLQPVYNRAPTDAVGTGVISTFLAVRDSCTFSVTLPSDARTVVVVSDSAPVDGPGNAVVVHRIP